MSFPVLDQSLKGQLRFYGENLLRKKGYESDLSDFDEDLNVKFTDRARKEIKKELDIDFDNAVGINCDRIRANFVSGYISSDQVKEAFDIWKNERLYYVLESKEGKCISVKCAKRGNDIYCFQTRQRFDNLIAVINNSFGDIKFFSERADHKRKRTQALFMTLTYDRRVITNVQAWRQVGKHYNNFNIN